MKDPIVLQQCLTRRNAADVFTVQALEHDRATFLAVHSPITKFQIVKGSDSIRESTEEGLLAALEKWPQQRSALFIVRGAPGCGKSHLIKWLHLRLKGLDPLPIFIGRRDSSLRSTIGQLLDAFRGRGDQFKDLRERLRGITSRLSESGQETKFLDEIALGLEPGALTDSLLDSDDAKLCEELALSDFFREGRIRQALRQTVAEGEATSQSGLAARIMRRIKGGKEQLEEGQLARFEETDLKEIMQIAKGNMSPQAELTRKRLREETGLCERVRRIVNEQINPAIRRVLAMGHDDLGDVFKELRRQLHPTRLMLLIEDISVFQGVDEQLLEAIDPLDEHEDMASGPPLAPIVSVVGITDGYYNETIVPKGNYVDRITHEIRLTSDERSTGTLTLDSPGAVAAFAARYLNALRTPQSRLEDWAKGADNGHAGSAPSGCDHCAERVRCHTAFGQVDGFGLFPFNTNAVWNVFHSLIRDNKGRSPTPRAMLAFLRHTVTHVELLGTGRFPPRSLLTEALIAVQDLGNVSGRARSQIQSKHPAHADELLTLLRVWGDRGESTRDTADGRLVLGLAEEVYKVLGLPSPDVLTPAPPTEGGSSGVPKEPDHKESETATEGTETPKSPTAQPRVSDPLAPVRQDLLSWGERSGPLHYAREHRKRVFELLNKAIVWEDLGVPRWFADSVFREDQVGFEDVAMGQGRQPIIISRNRANIAALEVLAELGKDAALCNDVGFAVRTVSAFSRSMVPVIVAHVRTALPKFDDGSLWDPALSALQLLYLDSIARGRAYWIYKTQPATMLQELLSEVVSANVPEGATSEWKSLSDLFSRQDDQRQTLRATLLIVARKWLQRTQGRQEDSDFYATAQVVPALQRFVESLELAPVPDMTSSSRAVPDQLRSISDAMPKVASAFRGTVEAERRRAIEWLGHLDQADVDASPHQVAQGCKELAPAVETVFPNELYRQRQRFEQTLFQIQKVTDHRLPSQEWIAEQTAALRDTAAAQQPNATIEAHNSLKPAILAAVVELFKSARDLGSSATQLLERQGDTGNGDPLTAATTRLRGILDRFSGTAQ